MLDIMARKKLKLKPMAGKVIVLQDESESVSKGGIVIPDKAKEKLLRGTVVRVGPDKNQVFKMPVKVGDVVYFTNTKDNPIQKIEVDRVEYLIMDAFEHLQAVVE